jgi:hypothetical protein
VVSDGEPPVEIEDFDAPAGDQEEAGEPGADETAG